MSQLETNTTTIDELITMANNLPDAGGGGGGTGGGLETCTARVVLNWGMGGDPIQTQLIVGAYNIKNGVAEPFYASLTSANDYEPQHTVSFMVYKNIPFCILVTCSLVKDYTFSAEGGALTDELATFEDYDIIHIATPTADEATFTFNTP